MDIYTVKDTDIVHETSVDFITRECSKEIHIVQYDDSQPIIAVSLRANSEKYSLPDGYEANIRFGKRDKTFVYKAVLGCNDDRSAVYFSVDKQMSLIYGKVNPIIEITYGGAIIGSSPIPFYIDRNPIQIGDIESKSDYPAIIERISEAETKASAAQIDAADAKKKVDGVMDDYYTNTQVDSKISEASSTADSKISALSSSIDTKISAVSSDVDSKVSDLDSKVVHKTGAETISGQKTFNDILTIKSDKYIKTNEIDNASGNALVRFKSTEGKNVFGGVGYDNVLMGKSPRPYYSKDGSDFNGTELALKSDVDNITVNVDEIKATADAAKTTANTAKATADAAATKVDGILDNYYTNAEIDTKFSKVMHLTSDETVAGYKTFSDGIAVNQINGIAGSALVRYRVSEDKTVFGNADSNAVIMGSGDRPYYSNNGIDYKGVELALKRDVESKFDLISNLENGSGSGSAQMKQDGTSGTFSFTDKNANATALDGSLTGDINYGAVGAFSASFGGKSSAQGKRSMAVGTTTIAKGAYSFASGDNSVALGNDSHAEGYSTVTGPNGTAAHSEGYNTQALGHSSHSEGNNAIAKGDQSHAEGVRTTANGGISHAEGVDTKANADNSHAEGNSTATKTALPTSGGSGSSGGSSGGSTDNPDDTSWNIDEHRGVSSHAEGVGSTTYGYASHAEGFNSVAYGHLSHAEGDKAVTGTSAGSDGWAAHAEGQNTIASGNFSHAEGQSTTASGIYSHTGGINTSASGMGSFAHGNNATASGNYSVAFGRDTSANHDQFALGIKNVASEKALLMVGNNKSTNAFEVLNDGRAKVQSAPTESNDVATKSYVDNVQLSAVEEANTYTDENLNNYYNKTAANNAFAEGPYKFVKVLDNSIINNTPLTPDINIGIVESSVSATVTYKAVLWKNSIDNTYKITMDIKSTSMTSCTLKPKALKIALVNYASTWRVPTVYMKNICANAMSQMSKWGVANCWVSNLSGRCLRDETTNIGKLNANGLEQVIVNGMDNTNICLALMLSEFDTDHVSDNLPIKGFSYHVELLTSKTTL